ncbi:uncharacterized protein [Littorina saxatilis]|uniref:uncharacterized protein isoform X2 n=1 Tax=Littorina saxatilis TaxID=31220 RepID=UPI0038B5B150
MDTMNLLALLALVCIGMSSGQSGFGCCTPKVWNSDVRTLRVYVDASGSMKRQSKVNYDANNKRVSVRTYRADDKDVFLRQVLDYARGERYVIEGDRHQKCVRHPLTRPFNGACVPGNTTSVYFARVGDTTRASSPGFWENTAYFEQNDVSGYVTVTMVDCAMVVEAAFGELGRDSVSHNIQYMNQTLHALEPGAFEIPDNCVNDPMEVREDPWQHFSVLGKLI